MRSGIFPSFYNASTKRQYERIPTCLKRAFEADIGMALGYDRIVFILLVESLGEKIHKCVLSHVFSVHVDVVAIDRVIIIGFTLKYNLHLIGNHIIEDAVFAAITLSVNLFTAVYDYLRDVWVVGKGAFIDLGE